MGLSKVVNKGNAVVFVHQLNQDGSAYAEDVTVEVQVGVDPHRIEYWAQQNGKIGVVSVSFTPLEGDFTNLKFPEPRIAN